MGFIARARRTLPRRPPCNPAGSLDVRWGPHLSRWAVATMALRTRRRSLVPSRCGRYIVLCVPAWSIVIGAEKLPLEVTVACTQSPSPITGVPYVRQSRKIDCEGSDSVPVMVCTPAISGAGRLTVTVSTVDPDPDPEVPGARKLKLWGPWKCSVSVAPETTLPSIVAPFT